MADLVKIGQLARDLPPANVTRTRVTDLVPEGAARLLRVEDHEFVWEPIPSADWRQMTDEERGRVLVDRAIAWMMENADLAPSPISYVGARATREGDERLFGEAVQSLREAICAAHRITSKNRTTTHVATMAVGATVMLATGIHGIEYAVEGGALLIDAIAERLCRQKE